MFTLTIFEILLFEGRSVLAPEGLCNSAPKCRVVYSKSLCRSPILCLKWLYLQTDAGTKMLEKNSLVFSLKIFVMCHK